MAGIMLLQVFFIEGCQSDKLQIAVGKVANGKAVIN